MAAAMEEKYASMKTETLLEELDRLRARVSERDRKMVKRLKNPQGHAHPLQFWPLCAEAYNVGTFNHILYWRLQDWGLVAWYAWAPTLAFETYVRLRHPLNHQFLNVRNNWWRIVGLLHIAGFFHAGAQVRARMMGLDENDREIERYGALYPTEIEEAAERKKAFEQEYVRMKNGFFNPGLTAPIRDTNASYTYRSSAPGMSGYFEEVEENRKRLVEAAKNRAGSA